jgi:hypothetical protein
MSGAKRRGSIRLGKGKKASLVMLMFLKNRSHKD